VQNYSSSRLVDLKRKAAFTLIELLVTVAIIGLLASVVITNVNVVRDKARLAAGAQMQQSLYHSYGDAAEGVWNLDEGTGSIAHMNIGNKSDAPITNGSWITDGPGGKLALHFNGSTSVDLGIVSTGLKVSVVMWVRTTAITGILFSNNWDAGMYMALESGKLRVTEDYGSPNSVYSNRSINDGKWHFVVYTSDGATARIYIDGSGDSSVSQSRSSGSVNGHGYLGLNRWASPVCDMSQFAIYTQTLGTSEIQKLYAMDAPRHGVAFVGNISPFVR
jgi:prepilin-type N-terminal cleavage/methylation domain-containing protein